MYVPVVLGIAREGRQSEKVAAFMMACVNEFGLRSEVLDVRDFQTKATDNTQTLPAAKKLSEKILKADALIIVSPEYNHGYPGELKMMLDMLYQQYFNKPVGMCGVSAGPVGGARAVEQLRQVCVELHMVPIREALYFPFVQNLFDAGGKIKDNTYYDRVKKFLGELLWYAKALKVERKKRRGEVYD